MKDLIKVLANSMGLVIYAVDVTIIGVSFMVSLASKPGKGRWGALKGGVYLSLLLTVIILLVSIIGILGRFYKVTYYPKRNEICFTFPISRDLCYEPGFIKKVWLRFHRYRRARISHRQGFFTLEVNFKDGKTIYAHDMMVSYQCLRNTYDFIVEVMDNPEHLREKAGVLITDKK